MKKLVFTVAILAFISLTNVATAQKSKTNMFLPGWYVGANMGYSVYMAEGNAFFDPSVISNFSLAKNGGFIQRIELGYNYTPVIGVRGFFSIINHNWPDTRQVLPDGSFKTISFGSEGLSADLMVNLTNWWSAYRPNRPFCMTAFGGLGLVHRDKASFSSDLFTLALRGGLQANFQLSRQLDFNTILEANIVGDKFNDYKVTFPYEFYSSLTVGLTYHLRERSKRVTPTAAPIVEKMPGQKKQLPNGTVVVDTIVAPNVPTEVAPEIEVMPKEEPIAPVVLPKKSNKTKREKPTKEKPYFNPPFDKVNSEVENVLPTTKSTRFMVNIFYPINESRIDEEKQKDAIKKVVDYMQKNPRAKITITGYADKGTGSESTNDRISTSRATEVSLILINAYGIYRNRITVKSYGSKSQPFKTDEMNRVVVVTGR